MFNPLNREKLVNAINYFVRNTQRCHTLKLFKLLHFLDFEHFRQTGFPVTGLAYKAWPKGPAPSDLWHEMKNGLQPDLKKSVSILPVRDDVTDEIQRRDIKAAAPFDPSVFSKRELEIMEMLAFVFAEIDGNDMSNFSHSKNSPWSKVYGKGEGNGRIIPYELSRQSEPVLKQIETLPEAEYRYRMTEFSP